MSDNKWFSQAGNLDGSSNSNTVPSDSARVKSDPTVKIDEENEIIKPVKGLNDRTVTYTKEGHRCIKCGAIIPQGSKLCWKCSASASVSDKAYSIDNGLEDRSYNSGAFFTIRNIMRILSFVCFIMALVPSFLISASLPSIMDISFECGVIEAIALLTIPQQFSSYVGYSNSDLGGLNIILSFLIIIPVVVLVSLFMERIADKGKAIVVVSFVSIDLFIWYRFYSEIKTIALKNNLNFETTNCFTINIVCLIILWLLSILVLMSVLKLSTDIVAKLGTKSLNYKQR